MKLEDFLESIIKNIYLYGIMIAVMTYFVSWYVSVTFVMISISYMFTKEYKNAGVGGLGYFIIIAANTIGTLVGNGIYAFKSLI